MQNPFESGHIKNYILFYVSVVVIMVLFFIASTIFRENKDIDKKVFNTKMSKTAQESRDIEEEPSLTSKIKLMDKPYK
ncbi:hypothetical protein [Sulfurimonas sp. CS5]|uniref:hypothetical protein n=1 Tax=Sulfurimonas sp. CS5 TaxID=3391145 RepID=UPI0039ECD1C0